LPGIETVHPGRLSDRVLAKSTPGDEAAMMRRLAEDARHIYLATGATDFRKQISGLVAIVSMQFKLDPFRDTYVFIFCNKKRDSIKVLRYDKNGFLLATKKLLDGMKFQWPRTPDEVKQISFQQVEWLLQGLKIEQEKAHHPVKRTLEKSCF
jgi:transposase